MPASRHPSEDLFRAQNLLRRIGMVLVYHNLLQEFLFWFVGQRCFSNQGCTAPTSVCPCDGCPTEVYVLPRQEIVNLTWYGGRVYDVVHQNIIFEGQLKDGGALDLPSGTLHVLCVETDDLHLHILEGVGYIVDPLPNNPWVVGDCGNYAQRAFDEDMLYAKNLYLDLFRHLEPLDRRAMVWRISIRWLV